MILRYVLRFHTRTVQSYEPLNNLSCFTHTAKHNTGRVCSSRTCTQRRLEMSHARIVLSAEALNNVVAVVSTPQTISSCPSAMVYTGC